MLTKDSPPLTEYETLALSIHLVNGKVDELREEVRVGNAMNAELLELFKGAKTAMMLAKTAGSITIKFSAFVVAIAALVATFKWWLVGGPRP